MSKKAFIHIGAAKCASSLIQGILNEQDSREIVACRYMDALCKVLMTYSPVFDFSEYYTRQMFQSIKDQLPDEDILFSCENLFGVHTHRENCFGESRKVLEFLFEDYDLKVMFFVRRQDTYLEGIYNQDVKRGEIRVFEEYVSEAMVDNLDWLKVAENYSCFDLTVLPFEKKVIQTGGYRDFIDGLYQWLGVKVEVESLPHINPSLSMEAMEVQRFANYMLGHQEAYDLSLWLEKHCPKKPEDKHKIMHDNTDLLKRYEENNKKLFEEFMPDFSGSYYWS